MHFVYIRHALKMLTERNIDRVWVERTVIEPDLTEPDSDHVKRTRAFRAIPERDGRVLRVVYERTEDHIEIVTCFLDRGRRRKR